MKDEVFRSLECQEMRAHLDAYLDGEIADASLRKDISGHLEACLGCKTEIDALGILSDRLQSLPMLEGSRGLRASVRSIASASTANGRYRAVSSLPHRGVLISSTIAVSLLVFSTLGMLLFSIHKDKGENPAPAENDLMAFVDDYVATVQSESAPDVEMRDPGRMESWFMARLDFAPMLPRWPWAHVVSGRLCFIHGQRVARVRYKAGEFDLTLFVQKSSRGGSITRDEIGVAGAPEVRPVRGFEVACWRTSELDYVLVGPASAAGVFEKLNMNPQLGVSASESL